jgi:tRNA dimethylallyltransferase
MTGTLIVVVGPTASGKTALAMRLAEHFDTEIISADSRQVYRELEVGTAKPDGLQLSRVPHHFINNKSITEAYDAGTFGREARATIDKLFERHSYVVMCGGSGLYIKAVLEGFDELPAATTDSRLEIADAYKEKGIDWLQDQVRELDPQYFEIVDKQNPQRLMRALEVIRTSGKPYSQFRKKKTADLPFHVVIIGLEIDRDILYQRIDARMDAMIQRGLFAEAEKFFTMRHLNALQTVGYQEIFGFLEGAYDKEEAVRLLKRNSRHYAKRQYTWFKKNKAIHWFTPDDWKGILKLIQDSQSEYFNTPNTAT